MSMQKIINPGFGVGSFFGVPTTVAVAETSTVTLTGTAYVTGGQMLSGMAAGVNLVWGSASNGITQTSIIMVGTGGWFVNDNASFRITNTTTSVQVFLTSAP